MEYAAFIHDRPAPLRAGDVLQVGWDRGSGLFLGFALYTTLRALHNHTKPPVTVCWISHTRPRTAAPANKAPAHVRTQILVLFIQYTDIIASLPVPWPVSGNGTSIFEPLQRKCLVLLQYTDTEELPSAVAGKRRFSGCWGLE